MRKILPCLLAAGIVAITGCNKQGTGSGPGVVASDDPLTFVPADTPYVIANIDPQPADVSSYWIDKLDKAGKVGDIYAHQIDGVVKLLGDTNTNCPQASAGGGAGGAMQDAPASTSDADDQAEAAGDASSPETEAPNAAAAVAPADASATMSSGGDKCSAASVAEREKMIKLLGAVKAEVAGKDVKGLMDLVGISPQTHAAFFGIGLVPVLRVELAKPDNLLATIGRLETSSGSKLTKAKVGNLDYWVVGDNATDAKLEGVFAISGKQLVVTIAPAKPSDADLKTLFGLDKPKRSLAESGDLAALDKKMNYLTYGSGYFDSAKLVAELKAPPTPLETSFFNALGDKKPQIDPVCAGEYGQIAAAWPRASFGYSDLTTQHMGLRAVLETRADIAKDLMTLRSPMPGMASAQSALVDFGFSADLTKLPGLATKYADATAKAPWKCPALVSLDQSTDQMKTSLTNPGFAGYAPMFHGFHLIADKIDLKEGQPIPDFSAVVAIGSDNPASLLSLAGSMVPGIATLGLKPDGVPKALPPMPNLPVQAPMFAAMTDKLLAISIGTDEDKRIADAMKTDPAQQPLLAGGGRGELYHLIATMLRNSAKNMGDAQAQQSMQEQAAMMDMYAGFFRRIDLTVELTEQGIELHESVIVQ